MPRGVYCGAFGWIDGDHDRASLAVAIRTFTVFGDDRDSGARPKGRTHLGVGGGIVADSCAAAEWAETELKGARLLQAASPEAAVLGTRFPRPGRSPMTAWIDGEMVPLAEAKVSVLDHGLVVGDGVFETLRVYGGVPFAWSRHLARLRASAEGLGLRLPDVSRLRAAADAVLAANAAHRGAVAHHGDGRDRAARLGTRRRDAHHVPARVADRSRDARRRRGDRALDPQRERRAGRAEDDLLRVERARARVRTRARRGRGDLPEHAGQSVRGHRVRTCSSCATASWSRRPRPRDACSA